MIYILSAILVGNKKLKLLFNLDVVFLWHNDRDEFGSHKNIQRRDAICRQITI